MKNLVCVVLGLAVVLAAPSASAQNLVTNSTFDTDVADWATGSEATIVWDPLDADGSPTSGSALVTNISLTAGDAAGARQCIDGVLEGTFFLYRADMLIPGGQSETGSALLLVQWYSAPGCGSQVGADITSGLSSTTPDLWFTDAGVFQAPAGTVSARLRLSVRKNEDSGLLGAHFDNVVFEQAIFVDGFESGDTTLWSITVP